MMGLFEVQRLVSAWPSLRNAQILRELLKRENEIGKVCLLPGHVVVGCIRNDSGESTIHLFDQVPLDTRSEASDPIAVSSQLIDVVALDESNFGLVCANGSVLVMKFVKDSCHWVDRGSFQLNCNGLIAKATMNNGGRLVYLVQNGQNDWSYSVCMDKPHQIDSSYQVTGHTELLLNCPYMGMFPVDNGVWMVPKQATPTPPNMMIFFGNNDNSVKVHVFCCNDEERFGYHYGTENFQFETSVDGIEDFKEICRKCAWKWRKGHDTDRYIVSISVHPISHDLLILMSCGKIHMLTMAKEVLQRRSLVTLKDFTKRYPSPKSWFTSSSKIRSSLSSSPLQLFVCHTYYGVCFHGELRVYDSTTGEFIWECDDLDHMSTRIIDQQTVGNHHTLPLPVALLNQSGIHLLKCKRIVDHASMFVDSLFPIATNADETTPGDFLKDGELYAAHTCDKWGLSLLASHYTIMLAYRLFKGENSDRIVPVLQPELLNQLDKLFKQSPSLCITLLAQYPSCHRFIVDNLRSYLSEQNESRQDIQTGLESETVPLLKQYFELSQQYDALLATPTLPINSVPSVRGRVTEILETSQQSTISADPIVTLRAELSLLCSSHPNESLNGIKDYMDIKGSFADTIKNGMCSPDINWKHFFASEVAEKASQTLKPTMQSTRLSVFESLCILLYNVEPNDLIHFVAYAHMVRENQHGEASFIRRTLKKEYFYQRALETLPQPNKHSTLDQIKAFSELCLLSDHSNVELEAINVLLKSEMWDNVIAVLKEMKSKDTPHLCTALFHRSMKQFSQGGVLHLYLEQLWQFLPNTFSILDFIEILKLFKHEESEVLTSTEQLSISELAPYILQLLSQENEHKTVA